MTPDVHPATMPIPVTALPPRRQPTVPGGGTSEQLGDATEVFPGLSDDPDWFKTAVFYEVIVRAFSDSTGAGSGDLRGLIQRLDYLQWACPR